MGYLRRPGNLCQPSYNQMGVSTLSSAPTSLRTTRGSYGPVLRLCPSVKSETNSPVSIYWLCSNLKGAVSTLVQTCLCMGVRAVVTVAPHCIAGQDR